MRQCATSASSPHPHCASARERDRPIPLVTQNTDARPGSGDPAFMSDANETILYHHEGAIGVITLNRPDKLNALTKPMWKRLGEVARGVATKDDIRCVIVRGAGVKAFAPGNDISEFEQERSNVDQARA